MSLVSELNKALKNKGKRRSKYLFPIKDSTFRNKDLIEGIKVIISKNVTMSKITKKFEKTFSKTIKNPYSLMVNSGSSANLLTMTILKTLYGKGEIILPTLTWVSDINSVIQSNLKPVFVDINPKNLCMLETEIKKKVNKKTLAVFMTHAQGFNGLSSNLISFLKRKKILLIEDVCESHGATFKGKKLGTYGIISNFSFYYAHHMSTIEGGMICTNDKKIFHLAKILRSHGMAREIGESRIENKIIIISAIDNLIKGASGQAVQNMNVAFKIKETMGLI